MKLTEKNYDQYLEFVFEQQFEESKIKRAEKKKADDDLKRNIEYQIEFFGKIRETLFPKN